MLRKLFIAGHPAANNFTFLLPRDPVMGFYPSATIKMKALEKLKVPQKPKRPLTPFLRFSEMKRPEMQKKYPDLKMTDLQKKMSEEWKLYTVEDKQKLHEAYKNEMAQHSLDVIEYETNLTPEQKTMIATTHKENLKMKEKAETRKKLRELGKPTKPAAAFILYMNSRLPERTKDYDNWMQTMSQAWAKEPEEKKAKFVSEANKLMIQYLEDLNKWEEKMIHLGHFDFVRKHVLSTLKGNEKNQ